MSLVYNSALKLKLRKTNILKTKNKAHYYNHAKSHICTVFIWFTLIIFHFFVSFTVFLQRWCFEQDFKMCQYNIIISLWR